MSESARKPYATEIEKQSASTSIVVGKRAHPYAAKSTSPSPNGHRIIEGPMQRQEKQEKPVPQDARPTGEQKYSSAALSPPPSKGTSFLPPSSPSSSPVLSDTFSSMKKNSNFASNAFSKLTSKSASVENFTPAPQSSKGKPTPPPQKPLLPSSYDSPLLSVAQPPLQSPEPFQLSRPSGLWPRVYDKEAIRQAARRAMAVGAKEWRRSMIMMVGEGRAGKTALLNSLMGTAFCETSSTVGIESRTCEVHVSGVRSSGGKWSKYDMAVKQAELAQAELACKFLLENDNNNSLPNAAPSRDLLHPEPLVNDFSAGREAELTKKLDQDLVLKLVQEGKLTDDSIVFSAWDYGGQEVFYSLHHLFLSRYGVYLVCFNMEWLVPTAPPSMVERCLSFLKFWLNSIAVHTRDNKGHFAPCLLIGTHKDVVSSPIVHEAISDLLYTALEDKLVFRSSVHQHDRARVSTGRGQLWFFPVDNKLGRADVVMQDVMSAVEELVSAEEYVHQKVPLSWLKTYDSLQERARSSPFMTLTELQALAKDCGLPSQDPQGSLQSSLEEEVKAMLLFFSGLGIVMYYDEPTLRDVIILDPASYLINPATVIIRDHKLHPPPPLARKSPFWWKLTKEGLLSSHLLPLLWPDTSEQQREVLVYLLVKFGLVVPMLCDDESPQQVSQYLVPSLLRPFTQEEQQMTLVSDDATERPRTFYIFFAVDDAIINQDVVHQSQLGGGFLPNGFFARVLGKCTAWTQNTSSFQPRLYRGKAMLCFGEHVFVMEVVSRFNAIAVSVHPAKINPRLVMERLRDLVQSVVRECMPLLLFCFLVGESPGYFLNLDRIVDTLECGAKRLMIGDRKLSKDLVYDQFRVWLLQQGMPERYDVFVASLLDGADAELSGQLFHCLSLCDNGVRPITTFWDRECVYQGRRVAVDPGHALFCSLVAVPLITPQALEAIVAREASGNQLLFEWILALEFKEMGRLEIMPLSADPRPPVPHATQTREWGADQLPQVPPSPNIIAKVREFLEARGLLPSSNLAKRTIKECVSSLLALKTTVDAETLVESRARLPSAFASRLVEECAKPAVAKQMQEAKAATASQKGVKVLSSKDIEWLEKVGSGIASEVWRCRWHSVEVAVKVLKDYNADIKAEFDREVEVNSRLPFHERMVPMNGIVLEPTPCIVLKYLPRLSIDDYVVKGARLLGLGDFATTVRIAVDASAGITHLHEEGLVHRDIACRNFLLDEHLRAYVCDFGLSKFLNKSQTIGVADKVEMCPFRWMAPEAIKHRHYNQASDTFMFGMFLFEFFSRSVPFKVDMPNATVRQVCTAILQGARPTLPPTWPKQLVEIITSCWQANPALRPPMSKINDRLTMFLELVQSRHIPTPTPLIEPFVLGSGGCVDALPPSCPRVPSSPSPSVSSSSSSSSSSSVSLPSPSSQLALGRQLSLRGRYNYVVQESSAYSSYTCLSESSNSGPLSDVIENSIQHLPSFPSSSSSSDDSRSFQQLSVEGLQQWFAQRSQTDVLPLILKHNINGALLLRLEESDLLGLGFTQLQAKRLLSQLPLGVEKELQKMRAEIAGLKALVLQLIDSTSVSPREVVSAGDYAKSNNMS